MSLRFRGRPFCAVPLLPVKNGGDSEFDSLKYTEKKTFTKYTPKIQNYGQKLAQKKTIRFDATEP